MSDKLIHTFVIVESLQRFSSNGQIWLPKKPYITRFNGTWNWSFCSWRPV